MAKKVLRIDSIDGGLSKSLYSTEKNTYSAALAIDPMAQSATTIRTSGVIRPVGYTKFSGTEFTGFPMWITTQPKTENSFALASDGKFHSFDNTITMRTTDEAGTSFPIQMNGTGNGMAYYDNFIYCAGTTDIDMYGGMDQGATIARTANVWTGAKFGLTALTNTTYPKLRGVSLPNHSMHLHVDNALYICDVLPSGAGATLANRGTIHKLATKRTTFQGDTNNGSTYNVLDLPYGYYPTDIESYGTDLVISAIQTSGATSPKIAQGKAALFFWDTIATSFYRQIDLRDPIVTALLNQNGTLFVFSGDAVAGARVSKYTGGSGVHELFYEEEGVSPFPGAVDAYASRSVFGGYISYPSDVACVFGWGGYDTRFEDSLHNIVKVSSTSSNSVVTSLRYVEQHTSVNTPRLIVGWGDDAGKGLDKFSGSAGLFSEFRGPVWNIGKKYKVSKVTIPLDETVQANLSLVPKLFGSTNFTTPIQTLTTINSTNFPGATTVTYKRPTLAAIGNDDLCLVLHWDGTRATAVKFPIVVDIETYEDQPISV